MHLPIIQKISGIKPLRLCFSGIGFPKALPMLPLRVVRMLSRERDCLPRPEGRGQGHWESDAVMLRGLLHSQAERLEQQGRERVDCQGALRHRRLLWREVRRSYGQEEKGE